MKSIVASIVFAVAIAAGGHDADAAEPTAAGECAGFKWNIAKEHALFVGGAAKLEAAKSPAAAPTMSTEKLYELTLSPQSDVTFAQAPGKKMLTDGAFAGIVAFQVPTTGSYRISVDTPFWIDVVDDGKLVTSKDFGGQPGCLPHKVVVYDLAAGRSLVLQASAAAKQTVRVTVTPVPAG